MHLKQIAAVTALASAALLLAATPANAAQANWEGTIDSGGLFKVFETERTSNQDTVQNVVWGTADAGIELVGCDDYTVVSGEWHMVKGQWRTFGATYYKCFRQKIRRWYPQDTNGILPGNGTTTLNGTIKW